VYCFDSVVKQVGLLTHIT